MEDMNCIWLGKQNPYDILCNIQAYMGRSGCVLEALDGCERDCPNLKRTNRTQSASCHKCIEKWMIERRTK